MCFGGMSGDPGLEAACEYARDRGVFLVASGSCTHEPRVYPAAYSTVMAVSSLSDCETVACIPHEDVDLVAPGQIILSTMPGGEYGFMSGQSPATVHVAGVAAAYKWVVPALNGKRLGKFLVRFSDEVPYAGRVDMFPPRDPAYTD
jgi:subtilisin family serine protease